MGVAFCVLFAWWFFSGIFMMYWDYPEVTAAARLARFQPIDAARVTVSPQAAWARLDDDRTPRSVRLAMYDGRPVYRFGFGGDERLVSADDGAEIAGFPPEQFRRVAAAWTGQPAAGARFEGALTVEDQWTVSGEFRALRPLRKYSWPSGEEVYVSEVTGAVEQATTRGSRLGAYLGAIPHWLYFTPLRKNGRLWSRIVIWASGIATAAALFGLVVGVWMYAPSRRVPYAGTKRLHMIFGLFFGFFACTWAFSGMLSMDPFPLSGDSDERAARLESALRGTPPPMKAYAAKPPREALAEAGSDFPVKELDLTSFAGAPVYLAIGSEGRSRIVPVAGAPVGAFDSRRILDAVRQAAQPDRVSESRLLTAYDAYYLDRRRERPLPVLLVLLNDEQHTRFYIDPRTARVVGAYSSSGWMERWLYHGLHSLNLPWLYQHRPAWDLLVLALLGGGLALSATAIQLAARVLRRKAGQILLRTRGHTPVSDRPLTG